MEITIKCNSLKELRDTVDQLVVLLPEHKSISKKETAAAPKKRKTYDHDEICRLFNSGMTYTEIANKVGCTYATVSSVCRKIRK